MLVSFDEIKNVIGKDLQEAMGKTVTQAQFWVEEQEDEILNFIAEYAWDGMAQVQGYLRNEGCRLIIKKAILQHIAFCADNNFVERAHIMEKDKADKLIDIAPRAYKTLLNGGLLYTGQRVWM